MPEFLKIIQKATQWTKHSNRARLVHATQTTLLPLSVWLVVTWTHLEHILSAECLVMSATEAEAAAVSLVMLLLFPCCSTSLVSECRQRVATKRAVFGGIRSNQKQRETERDSVTCCLLWYCHLRADCKRNGEMGSNEQLTTSCICWLAHWLTEVLDCHHCLTSSRRHSAAVTSFTSSSFTDCLCPLCSLLDGGTLSPKHCCRSRSLNITGKTGRQQDRRWMCFTTLGEIFSYHHHRHLPQLQQRRVSSSQTGILSCWQTETLTHFRECLSVHTGRLSCFLSFPFFSFLYTHSLSIIHF